MSKEEIKKIDEKGEEKISGGTDAKQGKKPRLKLDKDVVEWALKHPVLAYGGPLMRPFRRPDDVIKKLKDKDKKEKNPEDALTTSQPQDEEKK